MNQEELNRYYNLKDEIESIEHEIESILLEFATADCPYQEWMKATTNKPYINRFEVESKKINAYCGIYHGCDETSTFDISIDKEFLFMDKENRKQYISNYINAKNERIAAEERRRKIADIEHRKRQLEDLQKEII